MATVLDCCGAPAATRLRRASAGLAETTAVSVVRFVVALVALRLFPSRGIAGHLTSDLDGRVTLRQRREPIVEARVPFGAGERAAVEPGRRDVQDRKSTRL